MNRNRQEQQNTKHHFRNFLIVVAVIGIMVLIVLKLFTVKNVEVSGNLLYDDATIENTLLNDDKSWNSLYVFLKYKFFEPEKMPFIDDMTVSLKGPHTLSIKVYEKGMMGYLYINGIGENAYFDKDGFVVETSTRVIEGVPEIKGIECDEVVIYERLPIDEGALKEILNLTQTLKRYELVPDSIAYGEENSPNIRYNKLKVSVGDTKNLSQKIMTLTAIIESVKNKDGTLHLENWSEESTNIVFEPKK